MHILHAPCCLSHPVYHRGGGEVLLGNHQNLCQPRSWLQIGNPQVENLKRHSKPHNPRFAPLNACPDLTVFSAMFGSNPFSVPWSPLQPAPASQDEGARVSPRAGRAKNAPMQGARVHASRRTGNKEMQLWCAAMKGSSPRRVQRTTPFSVIKQDLSFRLRCLLLSRKPACVTARPLF